jgi:tetratricopeptide (TPR) repeat protein
MADEQRVQQLLDEILDSERTPEEVCRNCPELLSEVHRRWRQLRLMEAKLDALFPGPALALGTAPAESPCQDANLPHIPGYEVEDVLGRGGMGIVFRARHLRLNRLVALKMVLAGAFAGSQERLRFQREAEVVAELRHPNIVQIHDIGDADGRPYFTMEYIDGGSLAQKLAGTPQPARQAATLLGTLAEAVQAAHKCGIVHRDLKPANVLLTADGTPKISDFGLARRLDGETALTGTGIAVGTPSYMAPEQARGHAHVGPAVDVYALGAILYELLTGRPPFRAATAAETIQQVISQDPVPPSRLNPTVPRDLETVCLKCLRKEPVLRYVSAAAVAEDLQRFLRGEAIAARPEGRLERLVRRVRRRPALSAAIAIVTLLTIALLGGGVWTLSDREATARAAKADEVATERAADGDLTEMAAFLKTSSWPEAKAARERAAGRLGERGSERLRGLLSQGDHDLKLAAQLDAICLDGSNSADGVFLFARSEEQYEAAFREFGTIHEDPQAVAERIASSNIGNALVAALDHWAARTRDPRRQNWVLQVAREAVKRQSDPDPTGWRERARDSDIWKNEAAFDKLIKETQFAKQSVPLLLALDQQLNATGKDALPFLKQIQKAHPDDFWANFTLGTYLTGIGNYQESIRFHQAALALRPETEAVHKMLGFSLSKIDRTDEAIEHFRKALRMEPSPETRRVLAFALSKRGSFDEALEECRLALIFFPEDALLRTVYGTSLQSIGRNEDAGRQFQIAVKLDPNRADAWMGLRKVFMRLGRAEEALDAWGKALETNPPLAHQFWYGHAEYCIYLGKEKEYRRARQALLKTFGAATDPYIAERTSRACLLLPASGEELQQAAALADRAVAIDRTKYPPGAYPYFLFVKGLADYRQGRFDQAIAAMKGDASRMRGPAPRLVLAMALHRNGQEAEAQKKLAEAVLAFDWRPTQVHDQDGCIFHALRREAENMILPNLPAFLKGKHQPKDNDERFALLGVCQFTNRSHALACLYTDAFEAAPQLAEDIRLGHRYNAACAAAQAGCGRGIGAARLDDSERATWRAQSRQWLRAELAGWGKLLDGNPANAPRELVRQRLTQWQGDPDLACLREPVELLNLSAEERKDCLSLWDEVSRVVKASQAK